jgi:hypothetical protein
VYQVLGAVQLQPVFAPDAPRTTAQLSRTPTETIAMPQDPKLHREALLALMNQPPTGPDGPEGQPFVPPPPNFRSEPMVVGDQDFLKRVQQLLQRYPQLRGQVPQIRQGPTEASMREFTVNSKLPSDSFGGTTLAGIYDRQTHDIGINPSLSPKDLDETLVHEASHALGHDEIGARMVEDIYTGKEKINDPYMRDALISIYNKRKAERNK